MLCRTRLRTRLSTIRIHGNDNVGEFVPTMSLLNPLIRIISVSIVVLVSHVDGYSLLGNSRLCGSARTSSPVIGGNIKASRFGLKFGTLNGQDEDDGSRGIFRSRLEPREPHQRLSIKIKNRRHSKFVQSALFASSSSPPPLPCPQGRNVLLPDVSPTECEGLSTPLAPDLRHVELSLLPSSEESDKSVYVFPLVITPKNYTSNFCLRAFATKNRDWINDQVLKYGAVLFRGFDITSAKEVEDDVKALEPKLSNDYRGTSPRDLQNGTSYVFSVAEVPSHFPIAQHLEMSFLPSPPRRLFFSALQAPQSVGGETALTDFRKVYRDIPDRLRDKLQKKKLKYTRTHFRKGASQFLNTDISSMKGWEELFDTAEKSKVEEICKNENLPMKWEGRNADKFVSEYVSEPFQIHPQLPNNQRVWFNHAQVFHWTTLPSELFFAFTRTRDIRYLLRSIGTWILTIITYGILRKKMALHITFGDGTPISILEMNSIRSAIHKNMVFNRWQKGDLLEIDNFSTSHGREPTYDKGRKIVVSWSEPLQKSNDFDLVYG